MPDASYHYRRNIRTFYLLNTATKHVCVMIMAMKSEGNIPLCTMCQITQRVELTAFGDMMPFVILCETIGNWSVARKNIHTVCKHT